MNEKLERIHELMDELAEVTKEVFPDYTSINVSCESDGYMDVSIMKWKYDKEKPVEKCLRRQLFGQTRIGKKSEWGNDTSDLLNDYYKRYGFFLED